MSGVNVGARICSRRHFRHGIVIEFAILPSRPSNGKRNEGARFGIADWLPRHVVHYQG